MEARRAAEHDPEFKEVWPGWCLGDKQFRKELLAQINERRGEWHYGQELQESAEARAEEIIASELERTGWAEMDLRSRRKGDAVKVRMAKRLRAQTTVTMKWIAQRLCMGARGHLTHLLYWHGRDQPPPRKRREPNMTKPLTDTFLNTIEKQFSVVSRSVKSKFLSVIRGFR